MIRIAVGFDSVLMDPKNKLPGYKLGQPIQGAVGSLNALKDKGALIVIFSAWADTDARRHTISEWCRFFKIPYDVITNVKPTVDISIDINNYKFTSWDDALEKVNSLAVDRP